MNIPNIILEDAKEHGFSDARFGGEFNNIPYYVYLKEYKVRYTGLPCVVRLVNDRIEDVTDFDERARAFNYSPKDDK